MFIIFICSYQCCGCIFLLGTALLPPATVRYGIHLRAQVMQVGCLTYQWKRLLQFWFKRTDRAPLWGQCWVCSLGQCQKDTKYDFSTIQSCVGIEQYQILMSSKLLQLDTLSCCYVDGAYMCILQPNSCIPTSLAKASGLLL